MTSLLEVRGDELEAVLATGVQGLEKWIAGQKSQLELIAADPRIRAAAEELIQLAEDHPDDVEPWLRAPARTAALEILSPMGAPSTRLEAWRSSIRAGLWVSIYRSATRV